MRPPKIFNTRVSPNLKLYYKYLTAVKDLPYIYACVCVYIYIYIDIDIYTHTHIYPLKLKLWFLEYKKYNQTVIRRADWDFMQNHFFRLEHFVPRE